jgi:hypothetical protein
MLRGKTPLVLTPAVQPMTAARRLRAVGIFWY